MSKKLISLFTLILLLNTLVLTSNNASSPKLTKAVKTNSEASMEVLYNSLEGAKDGLTLSTFTKGISGYKELKAQGKAQKDLLVIIDFLKPSTDKRLWIIDMHANKIIENSLVAHGKNSGENYALAFSNTLNSNKSSLGFYQTGETYIGKHGLSMRLNGLDNSNSNAMKRSIVMHGAEYVSDDFIKCNGRLGRSHGCPAIPVNKTKEYIDLLKDGSIIFINGSAN